ncbi:MAG: hypothetical protein M1368_02955 [Thaumarchaeota archaeon]|nr:hypothetical protein [Nitrososphaerota archaeon]
MQRKSIEAYLRWAADNYSVVAEMLTLENANSDPEHSDGLFYCIICKLCFPTVAVAKRHVEMQHKTKKLYLIKKVRM